MTDRPGTIYVRYDPKGLGSVVRVQLEEGCASLYFGSAYADLGGFCTDSFQADAGFFTGEKIAEPPLPPDPAETLARILYPSFDQFSTETQKNQLTIAQRAIDAGVRLDNVRER